MQKEKLLLLHGALGAKSQFKELTKLLQQNFDVISLNFEGHGDITSTRSFCINHFAENIRLFIQEQNITTCKVFGYSMGGYVALTLAHQYPDIFSEIITLGTKFEWSPSIAQQETKQLNPDKIQSKVPHFAKMLKERHPALGWRTMLEQTAALMHNLGASPILTPTVLQAIETPIHCLLGDKDKMVSEEETQFVVSQLPNARFEWLKETPHPIEKVDKQLLFHTITRLFETITIQ